MSDIRPQKGKIYPLGSNYDGKGTNFALFSANATKVELCLFSHDGTEEIGRFEITQSYNSVWSVYLEGVEPGQVYGYRVYGVYRPEDGLRFNHNKLLLDPYGKKIAGTLIWHKAIFGYDVDSAELDLSFSELDSAPYVPKSVVIDEAYEWKEDVTPNIPFGQTVLYETHLKGYSKLNPKVPDAYRGTFLGLSSRPNINYLKWLGITTVELLPVHAFFAKRKDKGFLRENYWGYETLSFFALEPSYMAQDDVDEFKHMVETLHKAGLEVVLDVVYNHTIEGNQLGPTICYRGIDNSSYYVLDKKNKRYYFDSTGCGASFNSENPFVLRLIMDSLRYWVEVMHVDGFRFDLASTICRQGEVFSLNSGFLYAVAQDPVLQSVKLISEPWDVGFGGYQVGAFPAPWIEWNDRFRDVVRRFWKGDNHQVAEVASRISGSSDIFNHGNRKISASVNFITAHDGFSLMDLVSYNQKHNMANEENNNDGTNANWSWNSGVEGVSDDPKVLKNRKHRARALMATLMLSFGTPMMLAGDEFLNTQIGNNNPYCQDNVISWVVWEAISKKDIEFVRFVKKLISLRKSLDVFDRRDFFTGDVQEGNIKDLVWYSQTGKEFVDADWYDGTRKSISYCVYHEGKYIVCIFNAAFEDMQWVLPDLGATALWNLRLDTTETIKTNKLNMSAEKIKVPAWSVVLFEVKV